MEIPNYQLSKVLSLVIGIVLLLIHQSYQESSETTPKIPRYSFKEYSYVALPKYVSQVSKVYCIQLSITQFFLT